jgi:hypothetical protein
VAVHPCPFCNLRFALHTERDQHVDEDHRDHSVREEQEAVQAQKKQPTRDVLRMPW